MAKRKTDPGIEETICQYRRNGLKVDDIVEKTGVSKGTVKDILQRNGLTKKKQSADGIKPSTDPDDSLHAPARDKETPESIPESIPAPNPSANPSTVGINPNLNQANTSHEIIQYIQFFRSRTKRLPYPDMSDHDKVWAEGNYGKRWGEGIKMMIEATGLSAESLMQAVDDYEIDLTDALERFNNRYRD